MKKIGVLSQKGGVGKSSLASMIAVEYAHAGWKVLIADTDISQGSLVEWNALRKGNSLKPNIDVITLHRARDAIKDGYDLFIFDGAPHASEITREVASLSDLILLPTGCSIMDLNPQIRLAHELVDEGIAMKKMIFVMNKVGSSKAENDEVINYLTKTGYSVCKAAIPEKTAFRKLFREGKALSETGFPSLKNVCEKVMQYIVNKLKKLSNK